MNGGKSIKIFQHINIYDIEVVGMRITTWALVLIRHLYMPKRNLTKIHRVGYHKCKVYSDIEDTSNSNRVEPPNSICTAVRVGRVRIGQK